MKNTTATVIDDNIKNNHNINNTKYAYIKGNINVDNMTFGLRLAIKKSPKTNKFWVHYVDINENISGATYADDKIVKQASFRTADIVDDDSIVTGKSQDFSEKREQSNLSAYELSEFVSMSDEIYRRAYD